MSTIVTRAGKGSPLTHTEVDNNFTNLNADKYESGANASFSSVTDSGNLTFTGTGNRILGDFSGASLPNRTMLQTSGVNGSTIVGLVPSGTGVSTAIRYFNNSSAENCATFDVGLLIAGTEARIASTITGTGTYVPMTFATGGSERVRIDTAGNVGIGTSSPAQALSVQRAGEANFELASTSSGGSEFVQKGSGGNVARHVLTAAGQTAYSNSFDILQQSGGVATLQNRANAAMQFLTNDTERMRITSDGEVSIGTSTPTFTSGSGLFVQRTGNTATIELFRSDASISGSLSLQGGSTQNNINSAGAKDLVFLTNSTTQARITSAGLFHFNSGYGSSAVAYGCRAWVNFNGTGTVAIRASGNVSSITDNGTGNYRVNFSTAMPNVNYSVVAGACKDDSNNDGNFHAQVNGFNNGASGGNTVNNTTVVTSNTSVATLKDSGVVTVAVFR